jgi:peptidoglycan/xylan/chitin deacetylase (PgdA/CDA1 family)
MFATARMPRQRRDRHAPPVSRLRRRLLILAVAAAAVAATVASASAAAPPTIVSLGFDDGYASAYTTVAPLLASHNMHGTFFIISGEAGQSGYMTWPQIQSLAAAGNEIGGHTLTHPQLSLLSDADVRHEVCGNRADLLGRGFQVSDFAYPFGTLGTINATDEQIIAGCGYNTARTSLWYGDGCPGPCTQTVPASDPYWTTVIGWGEQGLADLEQEVTSAETFGGLAQIVFHRVCSPSSDPTCDTSDGYTDPATFSAFLTWLSKQVSAHKLSVQTLRQVFGTTVQPLVAAPVLSGAPAATTTATSAAIGFSGESGATFTCALDHAAFTQCSSPVTLTGLATGSHSFAVEQTDTNGDVSAAATATWSVQRPTPPPPAPTLHNVPPATTTSSSATISFTGVSRAKFTCSVDGAAYAPCTSPKTLLGLATGSHIFAVKQTDSSGNTSAAATTTWRVVDTHAHGR